MKILLVLLACLFLVSGCTQSAPVNDTINTPPQNNLPNVNTPALEQPVPLPESETIPEMVVESSTSVAGPSSITVQGTPTLKWTGGYADPSIVFFQGKYWMYLNQFGNGKETGVFVLSSSDGLNWKNETSVIFKGIATVRALVVSDKVYAYYPQGGAQIGPNDPAAIIGESSTNGKTFTSISGMKIAPHSGYTMDGPGVFQLADGTYRMYFVEFDITDIPKRSGKMWGASSPDGKTWTKDAQPTMEAEDSVEGLSPWSQILHPFIVKYQDGFIMLYNSHSRIFWAYSEDGFTWEKRGGVMMNGQPLHGADVDGFWVDDTHMQIYYGDFSEQTLGVAYTATVVVES